MAGHGKQQAVAAQDLADRHRDGAQGHLVDVGEPSLARLLAAHRSNLMQALAASEENILRLQRIADAEGLPTTSTMPLDIGTLDTVPAALMPDEPARRPLVASDALAPGSLLRVYLQGEWRTLMADRCGTASRIRAAAATTLVVYARSKSASCESMKRPIGAQAALLIRASRRP